MTKNEQTLITCDAINELIADAIKRGDSAEATRLNNLFDKIVNIDDFLGNTKKTKINFQRIVAKNSDAENGLLIRAERMTMDY